jgi:hypothetical protein
MSLKTKANNYFVVHSSWDLYNFKRPYSFLKKKSLTQISGILFNSLVFALVVPANILEKLKLFFVYLKRMSHF